VQPEWAQGEWAGGPSPLPCGQLTRCFSAVAELIVSDLKAPLRDFFSCYTYSLVQLSYA